MGLKVAEHLFETLKVRLVLTSRWQPPPQDEWPTFRSENSKINRALSTLSRLIERGAEILVVGADASSMGDMQNVVAQANKKFGGIHGVVHAAGSLDDGPLLQKTMGSALGVFNSKVNSALVLESLFKEKPLDMFVHFSSQASIHPAKGQVDYAGANAILDRLAKLRHQTHSGISCAMGWGPWARYRNGLGVHRFKYRINLPVQE